MTCGRWLILGGGTWHKGRWGAPSRLPLRTEILHKMAGLLAPFLPLQELAQCAPGNTHSLITTLCLRRIGTGLPRPSALSLPINARSQGSRLPLLLQMSPPDGCSHSCCWPVCLPFPSPQNLLLCALESTVQQHSNPLHLQHFFLNIPLAFVPSLSGFQTFGLRIPYKTTENSKELGLCGLCLPMLTRFAIKHYN